MKRQTLAINGGLFYCETAGSGEPVVFVHGYTLDRRMWQPQIEHFQQWYQVIAYDARGFGKSSLPSGPYSHSEDLYPLLHELGLPSAHLVGLSMGGRVAINLALAHPEVVRSLTLLSSPLDGYPRGWNYEVAVDDRGLDKARRNWLANPIFATKQPEVRELLRTMINDYSDWHWSAENAAQDPINKNAARRLGEITAPTLVLAGEHDHPYYVEVAEFLARSIPNARGVLLPETGHMLNLEAPAEVNRLIDGFLASLNPQRPPLIAPKVSPAK